MNLFSTPVLKRWWSKSYFGWNPCLLMKLGCNDHGYNEFRTITIKVWVQMIINFKIYGLRVSPGEVILTALVF